MNFDHETHYITNIYRGDNTEAPVLRASETDNSISIFTGWISRKYLVRIQTNKGENSTNSVIIGNYRYTMNTAAINESMGILFLESADEKSLQMFLYNYHDKSCFLEVVYHSKSNTVNVYHYNENNRGELIRSFTL